MKQKIIFTVFLLVCSLVMAQMNEDLFNTARLIIYGENTIMVISKVNNNALKGLRDYAMKATDPKSVKQLNDDDAWLLSMLCFIESNRRSATSTDEFLVYLQDRSEWLDTLPMNGRTGRASGWILSYDMLIRTHQLSVGET
jgi:hypothetical protein